jgi:hypothetical protein
MKNSGNEAKKYLKKKDITFLNAANSAHFARSSTPKVAKSPTFRENEPKLASLKAMP